MYKHYPFLFVWSFVAILQPLLFYFDSVFFGFSYLSELFIVPGTTLYSNQSVDTH